jgi:hypothetical protein
MDRLCLTTAVFSPHAGSRRYCDESLANRQLNQRRGRSGALFYQARATIGSSTRRLAQDHRQAFRASRRLPRYATVAMLMQADLQALKDESLDHISRRMNDITRRLDFGRAGKKVQGVENGVIASLDKLIEELEKQAQQAAGGGGGGGQGQNRGPAQGIRSSNPASESTPAVGKGPGNLDKKRIGSSSGWGDLPAKEREEALQQIGKDFPSHYREIVESYFRKIAESE